MEAPAASARQWKQDSLDGLGKGSRVWFSAGPRTWQLGTLQSVGGDACSVALDSPLGEGGVVHMSGFVKHARCAWRALPKTAYP